MRVVALTFHDIVPDDDGKDHKSDEFYRVKADEFESLLSQMRKLGYQSVDSRAFLAWQRGAQPLPERAVVLTFDDGHASHVELAAPLLVRYKFSGTFFVTTGHIGKPGFLSWDQLKRLRFLGMEIGSHGVTHRPLTALSPDELDREVAGSRDTLEKELGVPVNAIAAPGGFWNARVARAVERAGYEAMWVSEIGTNGKETSPLALRRVVVRRPFSLERVIAMVEGWEPAFWWAASHQRLIRLLKRVLGVYRYEQLKRKLVPNA